MIWILLTLATLGVAFLFLLFSRWLIDTFDCHRWYIPTVIVLLFAALYYSIAVTVGSA